MIPWLIIDGYNLIHRAGDRRLGAPTLRDVGVPRDPAGKRRRLIQVLEQTVGILAERITVVFDGRSGDGPDEQESPVVDVRFSPKDKTADTVIEQLVYQAKSSRPPAGRIVVVTSDRLERETAEGAGAETMACSVFLDQLADTIARIERALCSRNAAQKPAIPLGNPFSGLVINQPGAPSGAHPSGNGVKAGH